VTLPVLSVVCEALESWRDGKPSVHAQNLFSADRRRASSTVYRESKGRALTLAFLHRGGWETGRTGPCSVPITTLDWAPVARERGGSAYL